jgi:surface antigen
VTGFGQLTVVVSRNIVRRLSSSFVVLALLVPAFTVGISLTPRTSRALADDGGYPWSGAICQATGTVGGDAEGFCANDNWTVNGALFDMWGYNYRNCTSYVAWRLSQNGYTMPYAIGDARAWGGYFANHGVTVNSTPAVGAIAWESGGDHVAYVAAVGSGTVTVDEYNEHFQPGEPTWGNGDYDARTVATSAFQYIHVDDQTGGGGVANGAFVSYSGNVYRIAGGAPLYVSTWSAFGGAQPTTALSQAQWQALPQSPANGTFVTIPGFVYEVVGGAPLYVSTWSAFGGAQPTTSIDPADVTNAGGGTPWNHLTDFPADGTALRGGPNGLVYVVQSKVARYKRSYGGSTTLVDQDAIDHAGLSAPWNHLNSDTPTVALRARKTSKTEHATFKFSWTAPIQSSAITVFDVRYNRAKKGRKFGAWHLPKSWQGTTSTSDHLTMKAGYLYRVEVRAHDVAGNVSRWPTAEGLTRI